MIVILLLLALLAGCIWLIVKLVGRTRLSSKRRAKVEAKFNEVFSGQQFVTYPMERVMENDYPNKADVMDAAARRGYRFNGASGNLRRTVLAFEYGGQSDQRALGEI